ncbi:hypothetical protein EU524_00910 [Candidatus Thorarchaeota archaeon]|nr:MAG: hypothetical protein EU524_00910 [Candidatus Thorarchaeota archaeon]
MSKHSERYIRWFGTRVPTTSRTFLYLTMTVVALIVPLLLHLFLASPNLLLSTAVFLCTGVTLHLGLLLLLERRLRAPASDPDLRALESNVNQKVILSSRAELWQRVSNDSYIVSTSNLLFDAVIVSSPMREAMTTNPESGEVLLAFHLLRIPRRRNVYDFVASVALFCVVAALISFFLVPTLMSFAASPYLIIFLILSVGPAFPAVLLVAVLARYAFWRHDTAFEIAGDLYSMHPQVAKVQLERGRALDEDERRAVLWGVLEWEKKKRGNRRAGIAVLSMTLALMLPFFFLIPNLHSPLLYVQVSVAIAAASLSTGVVLYLLVREWDKRAMREVEYSTEGAREPIWMD